MKHTRYLNLAALCGLITGATGAQAQVAGQWDFNAGTLAATVGDALIATTAASDTAFGTTTTLGLPPIGGSVASVMGFKADPLGSSGYLFFPPAAPNGGGEQINEYSLVLDILFPAASQNKVRAILNANTVISPDADLFVGANNGIGGTSFSGTLQDNTWHRIAFVLGNGGIQKYIDGALVGEETGVAVDGRWAIVSGGTADLFSDDNGEVQAGFVNSIQFRTNSLNAGQVLALGGPTAAGIPQVIPPVPAYFSARTPAVNATGIIPLPQITATLRSGDSTIVGGSVALRFDDVAVAATITPGILDGYQIAYQITNILAPSSVHKVSVVWNDSVAGPKTNSWSFTVGSYQSVTLPAPLFSQNFDGVAEGALPAGWSVTNNTDVGSAGLDLDNAKSDSYRDWVVISSNRLSTVHGERRLNKNPIVLNGALVGSIVSGNLIYAESDVRSGNQVQALFTSDYNLTGKSNIFAAFFSGYEQNQDNLGAFEYSIDGGATWLPALYLIDDQDQAADVIRTNGVIDVGATMGTARADQAFGLAYSNFVAAPVSSIKPEHISGRINDDSYESKRIEVIRLPQADGKATVRFRFMQAGTASWYWSVDNFGLYSINTPVIGTQPQTQTIDAGKPVTFTVSATINPPYTYQWQFKGADIANATNQSYTIASVEPANAGAYNVLVKNSDGTTKSAAATLIVVDAPQITAQPQSIVSSSGNPLSVPVTARGRDPLSYIWLRNGTAVQSGSSSNLSIPSPTVANSGSYQVVVTNISGSATSSVVSVEIFGGTITEGLVAHIKFDGAAPAAYNDASGRGNNATAMGAPAIVAGKIGAGAMQFTTRQDGSAISYATLGAPNDLLMDSTNDFTVSMWVKIAPGSFKGDPALFGSKSWASGNNQGLVLFTTGPLRWSYKEGQGGGTGGNRVDYNPGGNYADDAWHHFLVSYDRGVGARTYIDGQLKAVTSIGNNVASIDPVSGNAWNIGQDGTGGYTDGGSVGLTNAVVDDVGIWRRVVTPQEVASIYAQGQAGQDLSTATTVTIGSITIVPAGTSVTLNWTAATGVKLQKATSLTAPVDWQDVAGTTGVGTTTQPASGTATFYRLTK
jgi:hypothetical protein